MSSLSFLTFPTSRTLSSDVSHSPGIEQEQTGGLSISYNGILATARWIVFGACIKIASRAPGDSAFCERTNLRSFEKIEYHWIIWTFALKRTNKRHIRLLKSLDTDGKSYPETQSAHSVAFSIEEKVAQLRGRISIDRIIFRKCSETIPFCLQNYFHMPRVNILIVGPCRKKTLTCQ